ncbi:MAG: transporter [Firmicutes bacterium]|nr:transporter [Bacillota bacterium]
MKRNLFFSVFLAMLLSPALPAAVFAEGFAVYEWSAAGTSMGDAYMFAEKDPAVIAYNPSQLTKLDGSYLSVGFSWINPSGTSSAKAGVLNQGVPMRTDSNYDPCAAPNLFYAMKAGKNSWWGIGIFSRFGNRSQQNDDWYGRYDMTYAGLTGVTIQPTYAFKVNDKLSVGLGLDINYIKMRMKKATPAIDDRFKILNPLGYIGDVRSDLEGDSTGLGWVISMMYDFTPKTSLAVVYRSRIEQTMDADSDFDYMLNPIAAYFIPSAMMPGSSGAHGKVTLPDSLTIGIGHKFNDRTRIELNAIWTNWSTYDALNITFDKGPLSGTETTVSSIKDWKASWRFGIGIQHKLSERWSIMGGYVWDQTPIPDNRVDFSVPTGDRSSLSVGFQYRPNEYSEWTLGYTAVWAGNRHVDSQYGGLDFTDAEVTDGMMQFISLGCSIKLK